MRVGMNVARRNFAHGTLDGHRQVIQRIRGWTDNFFKADGSGYRITVAEKEMQDVQVIC